MLELQSRCIRAGAGTWGCVSVIVALCLSLRVIIMCPRGRQCSVFVPLRSEPPGNFPPHLSQPEPNHTT